MGEFVHGASSAAAADCQHLWDGRRTCCAIWSASSRVGESTSAKKGAGLASSSCGARWGSGEAVGHSAGVEKKVGGPCLQDWKRERAGLAGAGLRQADDVLACARPPAWDQKVAAAGKVAHKQRPNKNRRIRHHE